jgi:hypothetical protein
MKDRLIVEGPAGKKLIEDYNRKTIERATQLLDALAIHREVIPAGVAVMTLGVKGQDGVTSRDISISLPELLKLLDRI